MDADWGVAAGSSTPHELQRSLSAADAAEPIADISGFTVHQGPSDMGDASTPDDR